MKSKEKPTERLGEANVVLYNYLKLETTKVAVSEKVNSRIFLRCHNNSATNRKNCPFTMKISHSDIVLGERNQTQG